ncbi:MAG: Flp family type IVb pilin [Cyanobacteria bacterium SIG30]|nr:Flp family type IVb pilin [Cyanobacteria bacterium SIG30]
MNKKKAQSLIEYALILALVTLIAVTVLSFLSKKINSVFEVPEPQVEIQTNQVK